MEVKGLRTHWMRERRLQARERRRPAGLPWRRLAWAVLCFLVLGLLFSSGFVPYRLDVKAGQVAPRDIEAPRDLIDRPTTERLRREAVARVSPVYVRDAAAGEEVDRRLAQAFTRIREVPQESEESEESEESVLTLLQLEDRVLSAMEKDVRFVATAEMAKNITSSDLPTFKKEAESELRALDYPRPLADFLVGLLDKELRPNFFLDEEQTAQQREAAWNSVAPATIVKGEVIVRKGQRLTEEDVMRLKDAGVLRDNRDWLAVAGSFLIAGIIIFLAGLFLYYFRPGIFYSDSRLILIGLVFLLAAFLTKVLWPISPFLAPAAGTTMLLAILIDPVVALGFGILLSPVVGLLTGYDLGGAFVALVGGLVGIMGVTRGSLRGDVMRAGALVALANVAAIAGLSLTLGPAHARQGALLQDLLAGAANGVFLGGVLAIGSLPYFENLFGILTSSKLLELSNPNHPLLRRLLLEAPGTYHHSLLVANLAEAASEAVGVNGLLARVGAYYHDVGKVKRPYFFTENQFGSRNPHNRLSPHLSSLIVTSHVKDGVELARQHRLPEEVVRFIPEHHGTGLVGYFYQQAVNGGNGKVDEGSFRHVGPVPQTAETAIVMLADASEAAVRALGKPTPGKVQATVRRVIRERLDDGQMDECDLTLGDLDVVAQAFVRVLSGAFHARIEYPDAVARPAPADAAVTRAREGNR